MLGQNIKVDGYEMTAGRNLSIDLLRPVAFILVVALHTITPDGHFSIALNISARFAVPFFFAVAGYFSYQVSMERIVRRAGRLSRLILQAVILYIALAVMGLSTWLRELFVSESWIATLVNQLRDLIAWNEFPLAYPLWFLFALLYVYFIYIIALRFEVPGDTFASFSFGLLVARFFITELSGSFGMPYIFGLRSWLFMGLPFFGLGIWLKCHEPKILSLFSSLQWVVISLLGLTISFVEYGVFGHQECYVGTIPFVLGAFIICLKNPLRIDARVFHPLLSLDTITTHAYIVHYAVILLIQYLSGLMRIDISEGVMWLSVSGTSLLIGALFGSKCSLTNRRRTTR